MKEGGPQGPPPFSCQANSEPWGGSADAGAAPDRRSCSVRAEKRTLVCYESPHRLADTLGLIAAVMGADRRVCVAREITKLYEEFYRATAYEAQQRYANENPKGEITLVIGGAPVSSNWDKIRVLEELERLLDEGESLSSAAKTVANLSGWKKNMVYEMGLEEE